MLSAINQNLDGLSDRSKSAAFLSISQSTEERVRKLVEIKLASSAYPSTESVIESTILGKCVQLGLIVAGFPVRVTNFLALLQ